MSGASLRLAALAACAAMLAGCAGSNDMDSYAPGRNVPSEAQDSAIATPDSPLQCVPYAREKSGIPIYGDAYTWWDQAAGRYARTAAPSQGAVLVLTGYAGPNRAHLAVVHDVLSAREIRVDHANWLDDGAVYTRDPVIDVSADNDWSQVRVWNIRAGVWGTKIYPVQGFIGPGPDNGTPDGTDAGVMAQAAVRASHATAASYGGADDTAATSPAPDDDQAGDADEANR
jgi:hypothetical protein